jgi:hypothetical protein
MAKIYIPRNSTITRASSIFLLDGFERLKILHRAGMWLPLRHTPIGVYSVFLSVGNNKNRLICTWNQIYSVLDQQGQQGELEKYFEYVRVLSSIMLIKLPSENRFVFQIAETSRNMRHRHSFFSNPFYHKA